MVRGNHYAKSFNPVPVNSSNWILAQAEWGSGHFRSSGTYVVPYYRTPANGIPYDNLC